MKQILIFSSIIILFTACLNQGAKRIEQEAKEKAENDSLVIVKKPFQNDPSKIEYEIPVLKGTNFRHGLVKRFYAHGSVYSEIPYIKNVRNGIAYTYYKAYNNEKPAVWKEQTYVKGLLSGVCKRYYESGKIQAEYEYKDGMPAIGLKEYSESGTEINMPVLSAKSSRTDSYYYVTAQLSKKATNTTFYVGDLIEGKYMPQNLKKMQDRNGVSEVLIPKDANNKKVTVVAVFYTRLSNQCIVAKTISLK